jgi:hypothetical protein
VNDRVPVADIKSMLQDRAASLARTLAPGGHVVGGLYKPRNPTRPDRKPGSFTVYISGPKAGGFVEYAEVDCRGDAIDFIAYVRFKCRMPPTREQRIEAIQWAKDWLGIERMSSDRLAEMRQHAKAAQLKAEKEAVRIAEFKRQLAINLWTEAVSPTRTYVESYMWHRGVDLSAIPHKEYSLRFHPAAAHFHVKHSGPAMVIKVVDPAGAFGGVHVTWISVRGDDKADLEGMPLNDGSGIGVNVKPRLMIGDIRGGVMRLTRGESGLTPEEAAAQGVRGPLFVGEGAEDAYTAGLARPDLRCWAAGSLGNLGNLPQLACVDSYIIGRDNDWAKPQAVASFDRAIEKIEKHGLPIGIASAKVGKDFNDQLRRKA